MNPIDTYRDAFKAMLKSGMTPLEALHEFETEKFNAALLEELEIRKGDAWHDANSLLSLAARAGREESNQREMEKAIELWLAGWTSETPHSTQEDVMSWYWRRLPRRKGKPGRRYLSTQQAYNAMKRECQNYD